MKWMPMSTPFPLDTPLLFLFESGGIIYDIVTVSEAFNYFERKETDASGDIIAWMHAPEFPEWYK